MTTAIHQPEHLPWYGYFHKIAHCDKFIFLDNVQFKKNYFENRNRILTKNGSVWLTVPVQLKGHLDKKFYEMKINNDGKWKRKYLKTIIFNYSKAPFFQDIEPLLELIENTDTVNLADFNIDIIKKICNILDIDTSKFARASQLNVDGKSTELLIKILNKTEATKYIMGISGFDYIDINLFKQNNIEIIEHKFEFPEYTPYNSKVLPKDKPSIIDMIVSIGKTNTIKNLNS